LVRGQSAEGRGQKKIFRAPPSALCALDYDRGAVDLKAIYLTTLARCAPDVLVRAHVTRDMPRNVVAIGKCAGALLDGVAAVHEIDDAFVAIPEGYRLPATRAQVHAGGHPHMTRASFDAGRALLAFVDAHEDILFLVSGGGSACVEVPLVDEATVANANAKWIASGMSIGEINARRRTMSAIKGGKLAARVRGRAVTLVYSDVSTGALHDVASGPTVPGSEAVLVADNTTLVRAAAQIIGETNVIPSWGKGACANVEEMTTPHPPSAPSPLTRGEGSRSSSLSPRQLHRRGERVAEGRVRGDLAISVVMVTHE